MRKRLWPIGVAALLGATGAGCARKPPVAAPPPPPPALEVPVVPPRVLAPVSEPEAPPVQEPGPVQAPRRERPRTPPRPAGSSPPAEGREPARPGEAPVEGAPPERPAGEAAVPLRTPQTANDAEAERRVRDTLGRATGALGKVNRGALSADAKAQYDAARRFVDQAQDALRVRNYMFAAYLADKAEALARGLQGR